MDEDLISSSEEVVTYQNLDIVNCAVATTILAADDGGGGENHGSAVFDYTYEEFYNNQATFQENVNISEEINCKSISKSKNIWIFAPKMNARICHFRGKNSNI